MSKVILVKWKSVEKREIKIEKANSRMKSNFLKSVGLQLRFLIKRTFNTTKMAKSKFEYVKTFERDEHCLPNCYIVVRIDGRGFSKFSDDHNFEKPNDLTALELMNKAAQSVMQNFNEIVFAFGQSDEYSFVFRRNAEQFKRRGNYYH